MMDRRLNAFFESCRRFGVNPTRYLFVVNIASQSAYLYGKSAVRSPAFRPSGLLISPRNGLKAGLQASRFGAKSYGLLKKFICSTSQFGIGEIAGSNKTPRGLHRIVEKIGDGCPAGTVFKSRKIVGYTWQGMPSAPITTRILWLDGLEPGFNRGGEVDSHARYIYIHGTGDESTIGRPASHGCVQLAARDLIPLYDKLPSGTLVWIVER